MKIETRYLILVPGCFIGTKGGIRVVKVKSLRKWGIYKLNAKEETEYGFHYAVIHPDNMGCGGLTPSDSDWECDSLTEAVDWILNYNP